MYNISITYNEFKEIEYGLRLRAKQHQNLIDLEVSEFCTKYATKELQACKDAIIKVQMAVFGRSFEK